MSLYNRMKGQSPQVTQNHQINPQAVQNAKKLLQMVNGSTNPQQALQNLMQSNPQIAQVMQIANQSGGLKKLFYQTAQQAGVNPDEIISLIK